VADKAIVTDVVKLDEVDKANEIVKAAEADNYN
jgi:hypothetical protein